MELSKQEYSSGLPFPSPGDLPDPGIQDCRQILDHLGHQGSHPIYNSLHLLIPNSQSFCPPAKASVILIDNDKLPITRIVPICTSYQKYTQGPMSLLPHKNLKKNDILREIIAAHITNAGIFCLICRIPKVNKKKTSESVGKMGKNVKKKIYKEKFPLNR